MVSSFRANTVKLHPRKGGGGKHKKGRKGSAAAKHGASDAFLDSPGSVSFPLSGNTASPYSDGGGNSFVLPSDNKFSGRTAGGCSRTSIYGTSTFGSGYPYGGTSTYLGNSSLPCVFWLTPCAPNYYGGDVYLDDDRRPGGKLVSTIIKSPVSTTRETYRMAGDRSSIAAVFNALVANCSITNTSDYSTYRPSRTSWPLQEQVIQYYRASSFVLSLDGYNNTGTYIPRNKTRSIVTTPLPTTLNTTFLTCINSTIAASVPLVDYQRKRLTVGAIAGIVVGALSLCFFLILAWCCRKRLCLGKKKRRRNEIIVKVEKDSNEDMERGSDDAKCTSSVNKALLSSPAVSPTFHAL